MPTWLQPVTYIIPLRHFLVIAKGLFLKDIPPIVVWDNIWPMALIGMVTLFSAGQFFKRKMEQLKRNPSKLFSIFTIPKTHKYGIINAQIKETMAVI